MLYTMLTLKLPFENVKKISVDYQTKQLLDRLIAEQEYDLKNKSLFKEISAKCISVLRGLLVVNQAQRLTIAQLEQHPWVMSRNNSMPASP